MHWRLRRGIVLALCALILSPALIERVPSGAQAFYNGPENIRHSGNCHPRQIRVTVSEQLDVMLDVQVWSDKPALEIIFYSEHDVYLVPDPLFIEIHNLDTKEVWTQPITTILAKRYQYNRRRIDLGPVEQNGYQIRLPEFSHEYLNGREETRGLEWSPGIVYVRVGPSFFQWRPKICEWP